MQVILMENSCIKMETRDDFKLLEYRPRSAVIANGIKPLPHDSQKGNIMIFVGHCTVKAETLYTRIYVDISVAVGCFNIVYLG